MPRGEAGLTVETIGLGMLASFVLTETIGLAAGGIVVPGYVALALNEPLRLVITVGVALVVFLILKVLSHFMLLFGRRMLLLGILLGYFLGYLTRIVPAPGSGPVRLEVGVIGYVIPGLIAYWMHRQGVIETVSTMIVAAVVTRLVITAVSGGAF
ncbi:MAG: poly-gamma-glutamate biosynthesis protein PgsC [candidate division WOR-3 bacterium]